MTWKQKNPGDKAPSSQVFVFCPACSCSWATIFPFESVICQLISSENLSNFNSTEISFMMGKFKGILEGDGDGNHVGKVVEASVGEEEGSGMTSLHSPASLM